MSYLRIRRCSKGLWFGPENVSKKTLLILNTSSGSAVIKKIVGRGGVHPLHARWVNRVKNALPLNSEFLKIFNASW